MSSPESPEAAAARRRVAIAIATLRRAAAASGLSGDDIERQVAATLAFVRRRLSGDYTVDDFGFDEDFTENAFLPLLRPLYKSWFRVEVRGIENIPSAGGALIVANHSGTVALDSLMTQVAVHDEHPDHRFLRMLGADLVFKTPIVGAVARKSGCTLAANPDAERLLASGELVGVWPEGFKGVGKPFSERYKLQRFGRDEPAPAESLKLVALAERLADALEALWPHTNELAGSQQALGIRVCRQRAAALAGHSADDRRLEDQIGSEHAQKTMVRVLIVYRDLGHQRVQRHRARVVGHNERTAGAGDVLDAANLDAEPRLVQRSQQWEIGVLGEVLVEAQGGNGDVASRAAAGCAP